jgi:hypothetical protein
MFYGNRVKMCEDFALNFDVKITGFCITTRHSFTLPLSPWNFLTKINMTVVPHLPYFSVSPIEYKTEWMPFSTQLR